MVRRLQPVIDERVGMMIKRLEGLADERKIINAEHMLAAFTNGIEHKVAPERKTLMKVDVVTQYRFGSSDHRLEKPDFDPVAFKKVAATEKTASTMKHFTWIIQAILMIPENITLKLGANLASLVLMRRVHISASTLSQRADSHRNASHKLRRYVHGKDFTHQMSNQLSSIPF
jgi:hypothetical protein